MKCLVTIIRLYLPCPSVLSALSHFLYRRRPLVVLYFSSRALLSAVIIPVRITPRLDIASKRGYVANLRSAMLLTDLASTVDTEAATSQLADQHTLALPVHPHRPQHQAPPTTVVVGTAALSEK